MLKTLWILFCYRMRSFFRSDRGQAVAGRKRSSQWPKVRAAHLEKHPACAVTGDTSDVDVHHIVPFDKEPAIECEPGNLITLSNKPVSPHLLFGHLGNFKCVNPLVRETTTRMRLLVEHRDQIEHAAKFLSAMDDHLAQKALPPPLPKPKPKAKPRAKVKRQKKKGAAL